MTDIDALIAKVGDEVCEHLGPAATFQIGKSACLQAPSDSARCERHYRIRLEQEALARVPSGCEREIGEISTLVAGDPEAKPMTDIDTAFARAERLCRRIAPLDLGDRPLYIVPQSRLPDDLGGKSVCDGFTTPSLDLYIKDVIGLAWRGRGACMVVDDTTFSDRMDTVDIESAVVAIVLHELAHILQRPRPYRDRRGTEPERIVFEALVMGDCVASEPAVEPTTPPFAGHEADFIRIALHLRHRAEAAGVLVPLFCYCAGNQYGLSHPNRYRQALGGEPARLADMSIRDILRTSPPEAFTRLWAQDVARWQSSVSPCPGKESSQMSIATVIERIVGKQRDRQAARAADYRDIVVQIADGKEPDADFVAQVLHEAGKSLDDLRQAVERLERRRELRRKLDSIPRLTSERRDVEKRIAAADRDLEAAEKRHEELVLPLQADLADLREQTFAGEQARGELWRTCSDQDLVARLADVQAKLQAARTQASDMRKAMSDYRTWASIDRQQAEGAFQDEAQSRIERAELREHRAERLDKDLPAVEKAVAALEREEAAIREQMLVP